MEKDQEIIQEYFTKHYPIKKKYIYNEISIGTALSGVVGVGFLGILIMIFILLMRKSNVVTSEVSGTISDSNKYKKFTKDCDELQGELNGSPLDENSKKEYSKQLDEITKLREEIKKLQEERKQETEKFAQLFEKIKSKELDKDKILQLIEEIQGSNDPNKINQNLDQIKEIVKKSKLSNEEISEFDNTIKNIKDKVKKEGGLLSKISERIKNFCTNSFEKISELVKTGKEKAKKGLSNLWGKITSTFGGFFDKKLNLALDNINESINTNKNIFLKVNFKSFEEFELDDIVKNIDDANFIYYVDKNVLIMHNKDGMLFVSDKIEKENLENIILNGKIERKDFNEFNESLKGEVKIGDRSVPVSVEKIELENQDSQSISIKFTLNPEESKRGMIDILQDIGEEEEHQGEYLHFLVNANYELIDTTKQFAFEKEIDFIKLIKNYDTPFEFNVEYTEIKKEEKEEESVEDKEKKSDENVIIKSIKEKIKNPDDYDFYINEDEIELGLLVQDGILTTDDLIEMFENKEESTSEIESIEDETEVALEEALNKIFNSNIKTKYYFEAVDMKEAIEVSKKVKKVNVITHKFPQIIKIKDINNFEPSNVYKIDLKNNELTKILSLKEFDLNNHFNSIILYQYEGKDTHVGQLIVNFDKIGEDKEIYKNILKYFNEKSLITEAKMSKDDLKKFLAANPVEIKIVDNFLGEISFNLLRKGLISSKKIDENEKVEEIKKELQVADQEIKKEEKPEEMNEQPSKEEDQKQSVTFKPVKFDLETFLNTSQFKPSDKDQLTLTKEKEDYFLNFNIEKEDALKIKKDKNFLKNFHPDKNKNDKEILLEQVKGKINFKIQVTLKEPEKEGEKRRIIISPQNIGLIFQYINIPDPIKKEQKPTTPEAEPTPEQKALPGEEEVQKIEDTSPQPQEVVEEGITGFIKTPKDKAIIGSLVQKSKAKSVFDGGQSDLYYYIKADNNYLYYQVSEELLAILVLIKKDKRIKYKNFTATSKLEDTDFIKEEYNLLKKITGADINKVKQEIKKLKKSDNVSFGVGQIIEEGKIKQFKFPTADNLKPKIKESNQLVPTEEKQSTSYWNLDSLIINEIFKNWKR